MLTFNVFYISWLKRTLCTHGSFYCLVRWPPLNPVSRIRHWLFESVQLCGESGSRGWRGQKLSEEPLWYSGLKSEWRYHHHKVFLILCLSHLLNSTSTWSVSSHLCCSSHLNLVTSDVSEKFDTDIRNLQPVEDKNFLNPRLSISTRFLSRFQDRLRLVPRLKAVTFWPWGVTEFIWSVL